MRRPLLDHIPRGEGPALAAAVLLLFLTSLFLAQSGVWFGQYFVEKGPAFESLRDIRDGMFRWDSHFYRSIATEGYRYDGDPCHEQNVVFMPAFPLLARGVAAATGLTIEAAGFVVVRLCLLLGLLFLADWVRGESGSVAALFVVSGLLFSPGSFAFHAWYSESTMLLFLALALWFRRRGHVLPMAVAAGILGATRVTAAPLVVLFCGDCLRRAYRELHEPGDRRWGRVGLEAAAAAVCLSGLAGWLAFLGMRFGNPFELIAAIKYCAWDKVHRPMGVLEAVTLAPLVGHLRAALERPYFFVLDIKTTNLIWTLAAFGASIHALIRRRGDLVAWGFAGYFALTFYATGKSEWLESAFRYYVPVFTIYLAAFDGWSWLRRRAGPAPATAGLIALLAIQVMYMVFYQALFTVQRGHYF